MKKILACLKLLMLGALVTSSGYTHAASYCAMVKMEIRQDLTFERQGFEARMRISNDVTTFALENLAIDVTFEDADGNPVLASSDPNSSDAAFFVRLWSMDGVDAVDGTGTVALESVADIRWLIVPAPGTGGNRPSGEIYYVGARVSYVLRGEEKEIDVAPDFIFVKPLPLLSVEYFLTADVFADDPLTPEIEPSEPFYLGVRVRNNGDATARNVKIESAEPEIVESDQGLLIDFRIIGGSVNDEPSSSSLRLDLGDIDVDEATVGRWIMETTLSGEFVAFTAEFSHADDLGGTLTSLVEDVGTHFLVRNVLVDLPGRDGVRDFLAMDEDTLRVYESSGLDTPATDLSDLANLVETDFEQHELFTPVADDFFYVKLPDPYAGSKVVAQAYRSDGKEIQAENIWFSTERDRDSGVLSYFINLFDTSSTGRYILSVTDPSGGAQPPVLQFIPDRQIHEGGRLGFLVEASDPDGTVPTIKADSLPTGATFSDETTGSLATYAFDWLVTAGQAQIAADGSYIPYEITFTASDGILEDSQLARITVCPKWDTDCDRMVDAWELSMFGTLDRDGTGDYDGDGISDLDEFLNGTEVPIEAAAGFDLIAYPHQVSPERSTCNGLLTALGANGPDDRLQRLDAATQQFETCSSSDPTGFPIIAGEGYILQAGVAHTLNLDGTPLCTAPDLSPGVNLRGHPRPSPGLTCFGWLRALGSDRVSSMSRFDKRYGRQETCAFVGDDIDAAVVGTDFPILSGEGYLISASTSGALALPGCP